MSLSNRWKRWTLLGTSKQASCDPTVVRAERPEGQQGPPLPVRQSGEIIDFDWGVDQWSSLLLKSDEQHPVDLEEPTIFDPRLLGTHEACTGLYACPTHDAVFNPIDTTTPNFGDSRIRWLTMGRIALYAADLCSRRKFLVDAWKGKAMRGGNKGLRASWMQESQFAYTAYEKAHSGAKWWGEIWQSLGGVVKVIQSKSPWPESGRWPGKKGSSWHTGSPLPATA